MIVLLLLAIKSIYSQYLNVLIPEGQTIGMQCNSNLGKYLNLILGMDYMTSSQFSYNALTNNGAYPTLS